MMIYFAGNSGRGEDGFAREAFLIAKRCHRMYSYIWVKPFWMIWDYFLLNKGG